MQYLLFDMSYFLQNEMVWTSVYDSFVLRHHFLFKCSFKPSNLKPIVLAALSNAFRQSMVQTAYFLLKPQTPGCKVPINKCFPCGGKMSYLKIV